MKPTALSPIQRRELALAALCDERTLDKVLRGEHRVRPSSRERIRRALAAAGRLDLLPTEGARGHR